ncbi:MAG TPA: lasso RiPP family leader peptide-containing protein [Longimicrobiales bacterium]|nr:lasso RiPP family leader peptide-containing protein [Longimicrobiales bacterium]
MEKKPYAAPTLVRYGSVVAETRGPCGVNFEVYGTSLDGGKGGEYITVLTPPSSQK